MKKITLATHVLSDGPAQNFLKYCIKYNFDVLYIEHPLIINDRFKSSNIKLFKNKDIKISKSFKKINYIFLSYFLSIFKNIIYVRKYFNHPFDIYIGFNCLNVLSGIFLKKFFRIDIKKVIYLSVDYTPTRYQSFFLNLIYQSLDKYCTKNADYCWCLSQRMIDEKNKNHQFRNKFDYKFKIAPMGYWNIYPIKRNFSFNFLYIGNIQYHQGFSNYIKLAKIFKDNNLIFKFDIIGDGEDINIIKKKLNDDQLLKNFIFHGYIEKFDDLLKISKQSSFGMAMYDTDKDPMKLINYTDSGKIKTYISLNLPFITNYEISNWEFYKKRNCSLIDNSVDNIYESILDIDKNNHLYDEIFKNIKNLENEFLWDNILKKLIV